MDRESEPQALSCVVRIEEILSTPIFSHEKSRNIFVQSAFIESIILLRDMMHKSE